MLCGKNYKKGEDMTVKEIIKTSASLLNREDIVAYLEGDDSKVGEQTLPSINTFVILLNLVISELAGTFIPMRKKETVIVENGKIEYSILSERPLKIINVFDVKGDEVNYSDEAFFIKVESGTKQIEYEYAPPNYDLNDTIGYLESDISIGALAYGLSAEFCICKGAFEEAVMWHNRYVESVNKRRMVKNASIKERSWR